MAKILWNSNSRRQTLNDENGYAVISNNWYNSRPRYNNGKAVYEMPKHIKDTIKSVMNKSKY